MSDVGPGAQLIRLLEGLRLRAPVVVELGVYCGDTGVAVCTAFPEGRYTGVDKWQTCPTMFDDQESMDRARQEALRKLGAERLICCDTIEAAARFADGSVDVVFVDATHTVDAVSEELRVWWPKVRAIMSGHDYYASWPAVAEAVGAFARENGLVVSIDSDTDVWWISRGTEAMPST
jgi:hypothetical protein